jgi:signal transduction histidine kinase
MPRLLLDRDRIEQVAINLVGNALKFTNPGGNVDVSLRYLADSETVQIVVTDTGVGIAREDQEVIFDEFAQLRKNANRKSQEGAGLGLAIVKRIVEAHSGAIEVESAPARGSTFTITLPARRPRGTSTAAVPA